MTNSVTLDRHNIALREEVTQLYKALFDKVGPGFHPDTPFDDYIQETAVPRTPPVEDIEEALSQVDAEVIHSKLVNQPCFTKDQQAEYTMILDFLFKYFGDPGIYDVGLTFYDDPIDIDTWPGADNLK